MKWYMVFLLFWAFLTWTVVSGHNHGHEHGATVDWLDANKMPIKRVAGVDLKWRHSDDEFLTMEVKCRTMGYVSIGFCPEDQWSDSMTGCDIILGWVDDHNATGFVRDYYAVGNGIPIQDSQQDVELIESRQSNGVTTLVFKRRWNTGDEKNDVDLLNTNVYLIYAWHPEDPNSFDQMLQHAKDSRGHTSFAMKLKGKWIDKDHQENSSANTIVINIWSSFLGVFLLTIRRVMLI